MKKISATILAIGLYLLLPTSQASAQKYEMRFNLPKHDTGMYYIGYH